MNKKIIITITGTSLVIFILLFGLTTYYEQKKNEADFWLNTKPEDRCKNFLNDNLYAICCVENGRFYNCTDRDDFKSNQEIEILVNPAKIQNIPEGLDYVCLVTDKLRKQADGSFMFFPEQCFYYKKEYLWGISGLTPEEKGVFTLLEANLYPNAEKDVRVETVNDEGIIEIREEFTILNIKGKI